MSECTYDIFHLTLLIKCFVMFNGLTLFFFLRLPEYGMVKGFQLHLVKPFYPFSSLSGMGCRKNGALACLLRD